MTRINLVNVEDLADQHLMSEWREIKMVPASLRRSLKTRTKNDILKNIPKTFTLNTGHVTFFFNKMHFLCNRYIALTQELENRDYNLTIHDMDQIFYADIPEEFRKIEWQPDASDIKISIERLLLRLNERPNWYRHYGSVTQPLYFEQLYMLQLDQRDNIYA